MDLSLFSAENYQWKLALIALITSLGIPALVTPLLRLIPAFRQTGQLNKAAATERLKRSFYMPIQNRSKLWGLTTYLVIFSAIMPFIITAQAQPWWQIPRDIFVILMVYDFFYYFTHRFVFHDGGFGPGPLMWVHAVHHQNRNPCRMDSNYLHPLETSIGVGLYGGSIGLLGWLMGDFHIVTIIVTVIAFSEINLHNHDLMEVEDRFPYRYLRYMSFMHHVHHARFTAGNFATITLLYDWLFGTYDTGKGWNRPRPMSKDAKTVANS
jgi:sterol desaturase/sphingolipid hydroxylase (fatty acid hydroxylase superfamily)